MKNLITMTNFVLEQGNPSNTDSQFADKVMYYANFLKQPLELWMFVPCDDNGDVLEEPKYKSNEKELEEEWMIFLKAKGRCLFEGFEYKKAIFYKESKLLFWRGELDGIIEDFIKYNLQLTASALKQIGL